MLNIIFWPNVAKTWHFAICESVTFCDFWRQINIESWGQDVTVRIWAILRTEIMMLRAGFAAYWGLVSRCHGLDFRCIEGWCQDVTVLEEHQNVTLSDVRNWTNGYSQHPLTPTCSNSMETTTENYFHSGFTWLRIFCYFFNLSMHSGRFRTLLFVYEFRAETWIGSYYSNRKK